MLSGGNWCLAGRSGHEIPYQLLFKQESSELCERCSGHCGSVLIL